MTMMRRAFHLSRMVARAAAPALRSPTPALFQPSFSSASMFQAPRNFSTGEQLKEAYIRVPIPMFGVTGNYASALYIAAVKADKLKFVESEVKSVMEAAKTSPSFQNFMKNSSIPSKIRVKAVTEIFAEAGFSDTTKNFLAVVAEHGRLKQLEGIVKKFTSLTKAHFGEVDVIVTSVVPLQEKEEKELKQLLERQLNVSKAATFRLKPLHEEEENVLLQLFRRKIANTRIPEKQLIELTELLEKHTAGKTPLTEEERERLDLLAIRVLLRVGKLNSPDMALTEKEEERFKQLKERYDQVKEGFKQLKEGKKPAERTVNLHHKIDRSILGGLVVEFEGKLIDMSIKTKLKKMEDSIRNAPMELLDI